MPEAVINRGVYGDQRSAAAGQGAKDAAALVQADYDKGQAKKIAREEREYVTAERERIASDRIYQREEDFYIANDIKDSGLKLEAGLEKILRGQKTKYGKIAGKGHKATDAERDELRNFTQNVKRIEAAKAHLGKSVGDYKQSMITDGSVSTSMDGDVASLYKDFAAGTGEFESYEGKDGELRIKGKTTAGCGKDLSEPCSIDYSYDQLRTLSYSPKYDLSKAIKADKDLLGDQVRETIRNSGGSLTATNTEELLGDAARSSARTRIGTSDPVLFELGAEVGFPAARRKAIIAEVGKDKFREQVIEAYAQKILDAKGSKETSEGNLSQAQVLAANTPKATTTNPAQTVAQIDSEMQRNLETGDLEYFEALYEVDNFKKIEFTKDSNGQRTGIREIQTYTNDDGTTKEVITNHGLSSINARKGAVNKVLKGRGQKIIDATAPVVESTFDKINFLENPADFIGTSVRPDGKLQRGVSDKIVKQNFNVQNVHELPVRAQQAMVARKQQEKGFDSKSALISYLDIDLPDGFDPLTASYASYPPEVRAKLKPFNAILQNLKK